MQQKPWGGRFQEPTDGRVEAFTASIAFDRRLLRHDIAGSIAHAKMLARQGIIPAAEGMAIVKALRLIRQELETGRAELLPTDEDIHMAVERLLTERLGEAGGRLHTGRSRNDQVALDVRLFLREEIDQTHRLVKRLQDKLVAAARREIGTVMPGYTHLQKAQPVLLAHYLLAFWEMLARDVERLRECRRRVNVLPLGAAALAGTGLPIDRQYVAKLLRFPRITQNSMDAVSDRDFAVEFVFAAAMVMMHLSRFCEDLVIWSSDEFRYVEITDAFTTGSSIMPQKKNPDVAELIRGKTGRVYGSLVALLTVLKGLPMTYNRDLQEDKEALFDTVDTVKASLAILADMIPRLTYDRERLAQQAAEGFATATDVAEYLVRQGVPFREAHRIVGRIVAHCLAAGRQLAELTLLELQRFHPSFAADVEACMRPEAAVNAKDIPGGTARARVEARLAELEGQT